MRKISFAAILTLALGGGALLSGPAHAMSNYPPGGGGTQNQGGYCLGTLRECLAECRGLAPQQYVWCHTNCILLNQNCLGYPLLTKRRHPIYTPPRYPIHGGPGHGKPIYGKPIYGKPVQAPPSSGGNTILERSGGGGHGRR
jgi:hypothetical protein